MRSFQQTHKVKHHSITLHITGQIKMSELNLWNDKAAVDGNQHVFSCTD